MVRNKKPLVTRQAIYNRLKREWHIHSNLLQVRKVPLGELGISTLEVNWLLNKVEWEYHFDIEEGSVSFQATLGDFIEIILQASKKQIRL